MTLKLELTPEEANATINLIDIAIKAGGVANARVGMPIIDKVINAANEQFPAPAQAPAPKE